MRIIKALLKTIGIFATAITICALPTFFGEIGAILTLIIIFIMVFLAFALV